MSVEPPIVEPGTPSSRPPRRWRRRLRRALHALILTIVVLIVAGVGVSQTAWFKDWLRRDIVVRAERLLDAKVSIGRVGGNLFTGIVLDDLRLVQAGVPVVTIDRVRVTYRVLTMRRNRIVLDSIEVLRPVIVARQTADGWTITRLVKPRVRPTGSTPITFGIDALRIHDGRVLVEPRNGRPTRLEDLDADLSIATGAGVARYAIRSVSLTLPDRALRLGRFAGVIERRGDVVSFADTRLDLPRSHLRIAGAIRGGAGAGTYDFTVGSGAFAFDEMNRLIPWVPSRPVQARFEATVRGPLDRLVTAIDFRSPAGDARGEVTIGREGDAARGLLFGGALDLAHVDPGRWANTPAVAGTVTGHAVFTLAPPSASRGLPIRGTFALTRATARVAGYEAQEASAEGRFDGARVTLRRAQGRAYGGRFDTHGTIGPRDPGQRGVRFALDGRVAGMDVRRLPPPVPRLRLATDITGAFKARLDGPSFDATMTFDDSTVEGGRVRAGSIGTFGLAPGEIRYGATARIEALDLGRLGTALDLALLRDPRVAGPITGDVDVRMQGRTIPTLAMTATATIDRGTVAGGTATATKLQARIADRRLDVDLDGDVAHVDPAVAANMPAAEGDVSGHVRGHFSIADLGAASIAEEVAFAGDVTLGPSRVAGRDITSASMTLSLASGVLGIEKLTASTPTGDVTAAGPLALNAAGESDLAYTVKGLPLASFAAQLGDIAGTVDVDGRLRGRRAALVTEGTARFADVRIGTAAEGLAGASPFTVHLPDWDVEQARVDVKPVLSAGTIGGVELDTGEAQVSYGGRQTTFDVRAAAGDRRVHAAGVANLADPARRVVALREAGLSFGEQTWVLDGARKPTIEVGADEIRVRDIHFDDGTGQIAEAVGTYALRAPAESSLHVSVRGLDLLPIEELLGQENPEFAGLLNGVARITGPAGRPDVLGSFAIQRGRYRELQFERVAGAVNYARSTIGVEVVVEQSPGVTLAINGTVPLALFTTDETTAAEAAAAGGGAAPIDINIESSAIGLQIVTGLTRAVTEVAGTATVKLRVTGTADNPLFDGGVGLAGGAFTVPATGRRYRDLTTTVRFEPGRMHVDALRVLDEDGDALEVGGVLGLRRLAFGDVQMKARAKRFGFIRNDLAQLDVDLDLDVAGQVTRPTITGTAVIAQGRVEIDRVLASLDRTRTPLAPDDGVPIVGKGQRPVPPPAPAPPVVPVQAGRRAGATPGEGDATPAGAPRQPGTGPRRRARAGGAPVTPVTPWSRTALDIRVQIPENLLLRGQNIRRDSAAAGLGDVSLVVGGDFRVQKERRRPTTLVGTITTARGSYQYYGRRFEILRDGRIQFTGGSEIDPTLDVTARRIIEPSGVEARIRVQGTARNPTLSFSSTPPLDESDVLALIVFNRDLNSLGASEKGAVASMAGTAAAGMVVSPLAETLGRKLGLEEIDVQTTNEGGTTGGVVTLGARLGDRLFGRLRQQFGAQEVSELLLEYRLSEFLRLQGAVAEGDGVGRANRSLTRRVERAGLDVVFYYRY